MGLFRSKGLLLQNGFDRELHVIVVIVGDLMFFPMTISCSSQYFNFFFGGFQRVIHIQPSKNVLYHHNFHFRSVFNHIKFDSLSAGQEI